MTKDEYKELVTPELIRSIFEGNIVSDFACRYAITVGGKIVSIAGRVFYNSREQAMKGFYNSFSWKVKRALWRAANPENVHFSWWGSPDNSKAWAAFKEVLKDRYGFDVIRL